MKQKNKISQIHLLMLAGFLFIGSQATAAEKPPLTPEMINKSMPPRVVTPVKTNAICTDQYKFPIIGVSAGADRESYRAGEKVTFKGKITNKNYFPIFDGEIYVRIGKKNPDYLTQGQFTVDEYFALQNIVLNPKEEKTVSFSWTIPQDVEKGDYRADFFFTVGKKYYLAGMPFTNEVVAGFSEFKIESENGSSVFFDKSSTKVNAVSYLHVGNSPVLAANQKTIIAQTLKNTYTSEKIAQITYDLYWMDGLTDEYKIATKQERVTLTPAGSKELSYEIEEMKDSIYLLRITSQVGTQKSIVNIRLEADVDHLRVNYPTLDHFPLKKGESAMLFSCFHNTSLAKNTGGKLTVRLIDKQGKEVEKMEYSGQVAPLALAEKKNFIARDDFNWLRLEAQIADQNGKVMDKYETVYDCNLLGKGKCTHTDTLPNEDSFDGRNAGVVTLFFVLLATALAVGLAVILYKKKKGLSLFFLLVMPISLAIIFGMSGLNAHAAGERTVTASANFSRTVSSVSFADLGPFFAGISLDDCSLSGNAQIIYQLSAELTKSGLTGQVMEDGTQLSTGDKVDLQIDTPDPPFFAAGGVCTPPPPPPPGDDPYIPPPVVDESPCYGTCSWNTPFGAWCPNKNSPCSGAWLNVGLPYNVNVTAVDNAPFSIRSSNENVIACSGTQCMARNAGSATITATIGETQGVNWYGNEAQDMSFSGGEVSWNVIVENPVPIAGRCGTGLSFCEDQEVNETTSGLCAPGIPVGITQNGDAWNWHCDGLNEGAQSAQCSAAISLPVNAGCGNAVGRTYCPGGTTSPNLYQLCNSGSELLGLVPDDAPWSWTCKSTNACPGENKTCEANYTDPEIGKCGTAVSKNFCGKDAPAANLCEEGTPSVVTEGYSEYTWSCGNEKCGGTVDRCSAPGNHCGWIETNP